MRLTLQTAGQQRSPSLRHVDALGTLRVCFVLPNVRDGDAVDDHICTVKSTLILSSFKKFVIINIYLDLLL